MRLCGKCEKKLEAELRAAYRSAADDLLARGGADPEAAMARGTERLDVARGLFDDFRALVQRVQREELDRYLVRARTTGTGSA